LARLPSSRRFVRVPRGFMSIGVPQSVLSASRRSGRPPALPDWLGWNPRPIMPPVRVPVGRGVNDSTSAPVRSAALVLPRGRRQVQIESNQGTDGQGSSRESLSCKGFGASGVSAGRGFESHHLFHRPPYSPRGSKGFARDISRQVLSAVTCTGQLGASGYGDGSYSTRIHILYVLGKDGATGQTRVRWSTKVNGFDPRSLHHTCASLVKVSGAVAYKVGTNLPAQLA